MKPSTSVVHGFSQRKLNLECSFNKSQIFDKSPNSIIEKMNLKFIIASRCEKKIYEKTNLQDQNNFQSSIQVKKVKFQYH